MSFVLLFSQKANAQPDMRLSAATEGQINEALEKTVPLRFLPSHPLYFLITTKESLSRFFQPSSSERAEFDFISSGKRLKETYMLLLANDAKRASSNLNRYGDELKNTVGQIEKARSQNQEVMPLIDRVVEGLQVHETLLFAIYDEFSEKQDVFNFGDNFAQALEDHEATVLAIDSIKPGIRSRFSNVSEQEATPDAEVEILEENVLFESTPAVKPRRIIY